jgi:uncharacterized membrane protein
VDAESTFAVKQYSQLYKQKERILVMLFTVAVILIVLWLLGVVTSYTMGGFIHVLLVIAIVVVLLRIIRGRNIVDGTKN